MRSKSGIRNDATNPSLHHSQRLRCLGISILDVWAMHADRQQVIFSLNGDILDPTFFDPWTPLRWAALERDKPRIVCNLTSKSCAAASQGYYRF